MKKLLVIALSAMMLFAFTACQPAGIPEDRIIMDNEDLTAALEQGGEWYLGDDITVTEQLTIAKEGFVLDGQGLFGITRDTSSLTGTTATTNAVVLVSANSVTLRNLTVNGGDDSNDASPESWVDGVWGIKVFNATGVTLSNVKVEDVQIGIQVNSSEVSVNRNIAFENTPFGGIGLDASDGDSTLRTSALSIDGNTRFGITSTTVPAVYLETAEDGSISGLGNLSATEYEPNDGDKKAQIWYFANGITPTTATPKTTEPAPASV